MGSDFAPDFLFSDNRSRSSRSFFWYPEHRRNGRCRCQIRRNRRRGSHAADEGRYDRQRRSLWVCTHQPVCSTPLVQSTKTFCNKLSYGVNTRCDRWLQLSLQPIAETFSRCSDHLQRRLHRVFAVLEALTSQFHLHIQTFIGTWKNSTCLWLSNSTDILLICQADCNSE